MTIKNILIEPNQILRLVSKPIERVGNEEQVLMDDMLETMYHANGIGLAAIQIGVPKRIIVMDISKNENEKNPMYFVNPVIKKKILNFPLMRKDVYLYQTSLLKLIVQMNVKLNI